jgi:predicted DNA-binding protein
MSPDTPSPSKVQITIRISPEMQAIADRLARLQGKPIAEVYRTSFELGLAELVSKDTSFRVHQKVLRRLGLDTESMREEEDEE